MKNIEKMTAEEFLREQIKKGMIPTCPIRAGERINFEPNEITCERIFNKRGGNKMEKQDFKKPIIIRNISRILWEKFKKICQNEDISMNRQVKKLVAEHVARWEAENGAIAK